MKAPKDLTVHQMDVLLCMINQGALPGGSWLDITAVAEDHYGQATGTSVQGRNAATRNILSGLVKEGYVGQSDTDRPFWQITQAGVDQLHLGSA